MLTADHVDTRRQGGELLLRRLDARARDEARELAEAYLGAARDHVGRTREELYDAWKSIGAGARQRRVAGGLEKLADDACEWLEDESLDPVAVRAAVFTRATELRRARGDVRAFDRDAVVSDVAATMQRTPAALEAALFADLKGEHVLARAPAVTAAALVDAYEVGRAQAVLLRAVRVVCEVRSASPGLLRAFFARLKFHRLLFAVERKGDASFAITIDGPFSMFESVTKYGLRFALVLPALRELDDWSLVAEVRWGKTREPLVFRLTSKDVGERSSSQSSAEPHVSDEVRALLDGIEALRSGGSKWRGRIASVLLDRPGLGVCVPDLVLQSDDGGEPVYVEVLGFWSRDAVWRRVELAQSGLGARIVFCVSARLRVSAEVLSDDSAAALYVYKGKPSARALMDRVAKLEGPYPPAPCMSSSPEPRAGSAKRSPAST